MESGAKLALRITVIGVAVCCAGEALAQQRRFMVIDGQKYTAEQLELATSSPVRVPSPKCSQNECEVTRSPDGHFWLSGSLNGYPVTWMVDTGASHSSVSTSVARNAGIRAGAQVQLQTAGGATAGAISSGNEIVVGSMRLGGMPVLISQRLNVNLLGASALQRMQISNEGDRMVMRLVR